jgi:hypothetical protein
VWWCDVVQRTAGGGGVRLGDGSWRRLTWVSSWVCAARGSCWALETREVTLRGAARATAPWTCTQHAESGTIVNIVWSVHACWQQAPCARPSTAAQLPSARAHAVSGGAPLWGVHASTRQQHLRCVTVTTCKRRCRLCSGLCSTVGACVEAQLHRAAHERVIGCRGQLHGEAPAVVCVCGGGAGITQGSRPLM